ncbi:MAG TPA: glycosyltransferase family 2 protein [Tahibacter sp.]|nr:glycosyltransferase family 2 protein [Tahibacter sp.]
MNAAPLTTVVVVAAVGGDGIADCVARVLASHVDVECIVSDNASSDGSVRRLAEHYAHDARVRVVENGANLGFGAGVNRALALARGDSVLVLNPDCLIEPDTIARLRALAAARPQAGLIGVRVVDDNGADEPASRRRDPTLRRSLASLTGLARFEDRWPWLAGVNRPVGPVPGDVVVEAVSGALMYLPRALFDALGGFDEGYFLHCEDLDLCRRVRDAGRDVVYAGTIRVVHGKGGSSRHRPVFVAWHKHRGMWRWFVKFDRAGGNRLIKACVWLGLWARFALLLPGLWWRGIKARRAR